MQVCLCVSNGYLHKLLAPPSTSILGQCTVLLWGRNRSHHSVEYHARATEQAQKFVYEGIERGDKYGYLLILALMI